MVSLIFLSGQLQRPLKICYITPVNIMIIWSRLNFQKGLDIEWNLWLLFPSPTGLDSTECGSRHPWSQLLELPGNLKMVHHLGSWNSIISIHCSIYHLHKYTCNFDSLQVTLHGSNPRFPSHLWMDWHLTFDGSNAIFHNLPAHVHGEFWSQIILDVTIPAQINAGIFCIKSKACLYRINNCLENIKFVDLLIIISSNILSWTQLLCEHI